MRSGTHMRRSARVQDGPARTPHRSLLHAMGWETANVHLGSRKASVLAKDLKSRPRDWLLMAARKMEKALHDDWKEWSA